MPTYGSRRVASPKPAKHAPVRTCPTGLVSYPDSLTARLSQPALPFPDTTTPTPVPEPRQCRCGGWHVS